MRDFNETPVAVDALFAQVSEARGIQLASKNITLRRSPSRLNLRYWSRRWVI